MSGVECVVLYETHDEIKGLCVFEAVGVRARLGVMGLDSIYNPRS